MIAPLKIQEIERLLAEGSLSQRKIARKAGVSRATVSSIANGARPDYEARREAKRQQLLDELPGPLIRCDECGGRVYAPAGFAACDASRRRNKRVWRPRAESGEPHPASSFRRSRAMLRVRASSNSASSGSLVEKTGACVSQTQRTANTTKRGRPGCSDLATNDRRDSGLAAC